MHLFEQDSDLTHSCFESKDAYKESRSSFQTLKALRCVVKSLASVIDDGIARAEKQVLPVSHYHGINSLPCEMMVKIMDLICDALSNDPETFKKMLLVFCDVPPFKSYLVDARRLLDIWKQHVFVWDGRLPQVTSSTPLNSITSLHFSTYPRVHLARDTRRSHAVERSRVPRHQAGVSTRSFTTKEKGLMQSSPCPSFKPCLSPICGSVAAMKIKRGAR